MKGPMGPKKTGGSSGGYSRKKPVTTAKPKPRTTSAKVATAPKITK